VITQKITQKSYHFKWKINFTEKKNTTKHIQRINFNENLFQLDYVDSDT